MTCAVTGGADFRKAVLERHRLDVRRYLLRRLRSSPDVDDLTQEVCLRFLLVSEETCLRQPLAYLYRIAANLLADYRSEAAREEVVIDSDLADTFIECGGGAEQPALEDSVGLQQQLTHALSQLPARHCSVLLAHKRDGFSYRETAARLKLSVHTVEKYVTQAKARLKTVRRE